MNEQPTNIDGIRPAEQRQTPVPIPPAKRSKARRMVVILLSVPYIFYILWCLFLISVLPNTSGDFGDLVPVALLSALTAGGIFLFLAVLVLRRALRKDVSGRGKANALLRTGGYVLPGLLMSVIMPVMIVQEPALPLDIIAPTDELQLVAPVAVTYSLDRAVEILGRRNLRPVSYTWDFDGDGQKNEDTVVPQVTAVYQRTGGYNVSARIQLSDGSSRRVHRRLLISRAVFSISPSEPIIDEPVTFSVAHLVVDPQQIREVRWDFDGDGTPEEVRSNPSITHTFLRLGAHKIGVVVLLQNQTQQTYERQITVREPPAQPFPVRLSTEPKKLLSPPPFGTIFTLHTEEQLREVVWDFGDRSNSVTTTDAPHRVGYTFQNRGDFRVTAEARSVNGERAVASVLVRVVQNLTIPDLIFDGTPQVLGGRITGEAPLTIELIPRTSLPLVEFTWEAPDATSVGSTETTLRAIYRKPGMYKVTLLASDPEGKALRKPISVEVKPPSSVVKFTMDKESGVAPLRVRFDASPTVIPGETISGFEWTFGDELTGVTRKQGIAIEEHVFDKPGRYPVKVTVITTVNKTYDASSTIVVLPPRLDACFVPSRTSGRMDGKPFGVSFDRTCTTGIMERVRWDFGDGAQSDDASPRVVHVYESPGQFTVTLTVQDAQRSQSSTTTQITIEP
jgi:PKD repeat protein